jgi:hypothetical protein
VAIDDRACAAVQRNQHAVVERCEDDVLETVAAPSGSCGTFVSHSTLPVARLTASTSRVAGPATLVGMGSFKLV